MIRIFRKLFGGSAERRELHRIHPDDADLLTADDLDWFGGLSDRDIVRLNKQDDFFRMAAFLKAKEEGLDATAAARRCWHYFPYYYIDPATRGGNSLGLVGANAELPYAIRDRVSRTAAAGRLERRLVEEHETMNAAIRKILLEERLVNLAANATKY